MPARARHLLAVLAIGVLATATAPVAGAAPEAQSFHRVATVPAFLNAADPTEEAVAEISTVTDGGNTVAYTDAAGERIGFFDITDPHAPVPTGTFAVGGSPTSVQATGEYLLVAVDTSTSFTEPSGHLVVIGPDREEVRTSISAGSRTRSR